MSHTTQSKHISKIQPGDIIMHNGVMKTVCGVDIKMDSFMGKTIFGDSYNLGYKPVIVCFLGETRA